MLLAFHVAISKGLTKTSSGRKGTGRVSHGQEGMQQNMRQLILSYYIQSQGVISAQLFHSLCSLQNRMVLQTFKIGLHCDAGCRSRYLTRVVKE